MDGNGSRSFKRPAGTQHEPMPAHRGDVSSLPRAAMPADALGTSGPDPEGGAGLPRRILLVSAMALFAQGLRVMLDASQVFHVAGECNDAAAALADIERLEPGMVVLDEDMPDIDPFDLAARIKRRHPGVGIVLLTEAASLASSRQAAGSNVDACVPKTAGFAELLSTLHRVASHHLGPASATGPRHSDAWSLLQEAAERRRELTRNEWRLMRLMTQGLGDRMTAAMLGVSPSRLAAQRDALMSKLGFGSVDESIDGQRTMKRSSR